MASRFLLVSAAAFLLLTLLILTVWNLGLPALGLPGRVPERFASQDEELRDRVLDRALVLSTWLAAQGSGAELLARVDEGNPRIAALAKKGLGDIEADEGRPGLELRYLRLLSSSTAGIRILVVRNSDTVILADSRGLRAGSHLASAPQIRDLSAGQYLVGDSVYSFAAAKSPEGRALTFILVAPLESLLSASAPPLEGAFSPGFALFDDSGRVIGSQGIPDPELRFAAGARPIEKAELSRLAASPGIAVRDFDGGLLALSAARVELSGGASLYLMEAASRSAVIKELERDSLAMGLLVLLGTGLALVFVRLRLHSLLGPLRRLHEAVLAFGRSEPFDLPTDLPGEVGAITRAFLGLTRRVVLWRGELEAVVEQRTRMFRLVAEVNAIFARDETEQAIVAASEALKDSFHAETAAIFYTNAKREYRYCLAGAEFPIALPEGRWKESVGPAYEGSAVARFGPWAPPGLDTPLPYWIGRRLYSSEDTGGFLLLGRSGAEWTAEDEENLEDIARNLRPVILVRRDRQRQTEERREAEERLSANERRLRNFLEGSLDMIYTLDARDIVTDINASGVELLGWDGKEGVIGRNFSDFCLNPEDRQRFLAEIRLRGFASDSEIVINRKDGRKVFCLETAYAIRDAKGDILEIMAISKDITDRIENERSLWKMNLELADANSRIQRTQTLMVQHEKLASIGQLAAGVAHEINNPLSFLKSNHESLERYLRKIRSILDRALPRSPSVLPQEEGEELERRFSQIEEMLAESDEGFDRIMHIVSSLKTFSRSGESEGAGSYDLNAGIESTLIVAMNEIKYVAEIRKELAPLPPLRARGSEINQVLLNILVNAAQAIGGQQRSEKGLITVRSALEGDMVRVEIGDDGPGIPESLRTKIFDPFFTTKEPGKGTGLGLSISYDIIVSKHGGSLDLTSSPGKGSTFIIRLPLRGKDEGPEAG